MGDQFSSSASSTLKGDAITTSDWILDSLRRFAERNSNWSSIGVAFLSGIIVNAWSDPNLKYFGEVLDRVLNVQRPINIFSWLAIFVIIFFSIGRYLLTWITSKRKYQIRLSRLFADKAEEPASLYLRGRITWGSSLTILSCPNLHAGWPIEEVVIEHLSNRFVLIKEDEPSYQKFMSTVFNKRPNPSDNTCLMLTRCPVSFTDEPILSVQVKETKWSYTQFFRKWVWDNPTKINDKIMQVLGGQVIDFPNSLALLMVISTSDDYVLLTKTVPSSDFFANHWACSIGEHLNLKDLDGNKKKYVLNWVNRAFRDEFGHVNVEFDPKNARIMAVILETRLMNFALIGVVTLNCNKKELENILCSSPKPDREFEDWEFIHWNKISNELIKPSRNYHPSTGLRMFYAGIHRFGVAEFTRQLLVAKEKK